MSISLIRCLLAVLALSESFDVVASKDVAQLRAGHLLQGFAHDLHAIDEQSEGADNLKNYPNRHIFI